MISPQSLNCLVTVSFSSIDPQGSPRNDAGPMHFLGLRFLGVAPLGARKYRMGRGAGAGLLTVRSCSAAS